MTRMTKNSAATPSMAGTKAMIQVGAATQFDSTSQKTVPKKSLQHPPLQKLGSEQPVLISKYSNNSIHHKTYVKYTLLISLFSKNIAV